MGGEGVLNLLTDDGDLRAQCHMPIIDSLILRTIYLPHNKGNMGLLQRIHMYLCYYIYYHWCKTCQRIMVIENAMSLAHNA